MASKKFPMHRMTRVAWSNFGNDSAIVSELVLDFRNRNGEVENTVITLENGCGKTTLISSILAVVMGLGKEEWVQNEQNRRENGASASGNDPKAFFPVQGLTLIALEIEMPYLPSNGEPTRYVLGVAVERRTGDDDLNRRHFVFRVTPGLAMEDLPMSCFGNPEFSSMREFTAWVEETRKKVQELKLFRYLSPMNPDGANQEKYWFEWLSTIGVDVPAFSSLVRMNSQEGGSPSQERDFATMFFRLALQKPELAKAHNSVAETVARYLEHPNQEKKRDAYEKVSRQFDLLAPESENYRQADGRIREINGQIAFLVSGLDASGKAGEEKLAAISAEIPKKEEEIKELSTKTEAAQAGLRSAKYERYLRNTEDAEKRLSGIEDELREKTSEIATLPVIQSKLEKASLEARLASLVAQMADSDEQRRIRRAAADYVSSLAGFRKMLERQKEALDADIRERNEKIKETGDKFSALTLSQGKTISEKERLEKQKSELDAGRKALSDILSPGDNPRAVHGRMLSRKEEIGKILQSLDTEREKESAEKERTDTVLSERKIELEKKKFVFSRIHERHELAKKEKTAITANDRFFSVMRGDAPDMAECRSRLKAIIEEHEEKIALFSREESRARENLELLEDNGGQWEEATRLVDFLVERKIFSANPGFRELRESGAVDPAGKVAANPGKYLGVVVSDADEFEKALKMDFSGAGLRYPVQVSLPDESPVAEKFFTVMPSGSWLWDPDALELEKNDAFTRHKLLLEQIGSVKADKQAFSALLENVDAWIAKHADTWNEDEEALPVLEKECALLAEIISRIEKERKAHVARIKEIEAAARDGREKEKTLGDDIRRLENYLKEFDRYPGDEKLISLAMEVSRQKEESGRLEKQLGDLKEALRLDTEKKGGIENSLRKLNTDMSEPLRDAGEEKSDVSASDEGELENFRIRWLDAKKKVNDGIGGQIEGLKGEIRRLEKEVDALVRKPGYSPAIEERYADVHPEEFERLLSRANEKITILKDAKDQALADRVKAQEELKTFRKETGVSVRDTRFTDISREELNTAVFRFEQEAETLSVALKTAEEKGKELRKGKDITETLLKRIGKLRKNITSVFTDLPEAAETAAPSDIASFLDAAEDRHIELADARKEVRKALDESWRKLEKLLAKVKSVEFPEDDDTVFVRKIRMEDVLDKESYDLLKKRMVDAYLTAKADCDALERDNIQNIEICCSTIRKAAAYLVNACSVKIPITKNMEKYGYGERHILKCNLARGNYGDIETALKRRVHELCENNRARKSRGEKTNIPEMASIIADVLKKSCPKERGLEIKVLVPETSGKIRYDSADNPHGSGAQRFMILALTYILLNYVRSGSGEGKRGMSLVMDNPYGKTQARALLDLLLAVSKDLGQHLVFFTGMEDPNILFGIENVIPLQREHDGNRGFIVPLQNPSVGFRMETDEPR